VTSIVGEPSITPIHGTRPYDVWLQQEGVLVHTGYHVEDTRTLELGWWDRRGCNAAFLQLAGQEGVSEAHVVELAPGQSLQPFKVAVDEVHYVVRGQGLTTLSAADETPKRTFEWQEHSMFYVPPNHTYELANTRGDVPARILVFSSLPLAMQITPDLDYFFDNPYVNREALSGDGMDDYYAEARAVTIKIDSKMRVATKETPLEDTYDSNLWFGSFFPDLRSWDRLNPLKGRGAGGSVVWVRFPDAVTAAHMSVFPAQTYKKAHRHGPGTVIVIPAGHGYSVMWREGEDKVIIPWHEGSVFVPPDYWFHQHFNTTDQPARYLALHPPGKRITSESIADPGRDQIEYTDEDPFIRDHFEQQLAANGLASRMPKEAYQDATWEWSYGGG
jgi:mannose-6-phosphate isomerase-like protein (cupin superfamily)